MTRRISLVAACCSAPSRISCACAAILFFSAATESLEEEARFLRLAFLRGFLFICKETRLGTPVQVHVMHTKSAAVKDDKRRPGRLCVGNPKFEYRNPKQIQMFKIQILQTDSFRFRSFNFFILDPVWVRLFRISCFGFSYLGVVAPLREDFSPCCASFNPCHRSVRIAASHVRQTAQGF